MSIVFLTKMIDTSSSDTRLKMLTWKFAVCIRSYWIFLCEALITQSTAIGHLHLKPANIVPTLLFIILSILLCLDNFSNSFRETVKVWKLISRITIMKWRRSGQGQRVIFIRQIVPNGLFILNKRPLIFPAICIYENKLCPAQSVIFVHA